jgi:hypothetical protein
MKPGLGSVLFALIALIGLMTAPAHGQGKFGKPGAGGGGPKAAGGAAGNFGGGPPANFGGMPPNFGGGPPPNFGGGPPANFGGMPPNFGGDPFGVKPPKDNSGTTTADTAKSLGVGFTIVGILFILLGVGVVGGSTVLLLKSQSR